MKKFDILIGAEKIKINPEKIVVVRFASFLVVTCLYVFFYTFSRLPMYVLDETNGYGEL